MYYSEVTLYCFHLSMHFSDKTVQHRQIFLHQSDQLLCEQLCR